LAAGVIEDGFTEIKRAGIQAHLLDVDYFAIITR
jgi:hypothetical protein